MDVPWLMPGASEKPLNDALYALHCHVVETLDQIVVAQCGEDGEGIQAAYLAWVMEIFSRNVAIAVPGIMTVALACGASKDDLADMFTVSKEKLDEMFPGLDRMLEAQLLANATDSDVEVTVPSRQGGHIRFPMPPSAATG